MAKVTIEFPSVEMANLFASMFPTGEFANMINGIAETQDDYNERLDLYIEPDWDMDERGNHKIDLDDYLL